jgi:lipoprotein-anchoring transpeptidase ErfK/SrfK
VTVDWHNPTGGTQPDLTGKNNLTVDVDLAAQEATISDANGSPLYTMLISSGMNDATPHGTFTIGQRGLSFYTPSEGMGAKWWTSFLGTGYLFHSVPTNANGDYIASEGAKLGNAASHGCVRLSIADAQWFYDQIPSGTRVHIH